MASACPLSIINGSGWFFQNCASVCCSCLRVLLVCLLESAISLLVVANFKNILPIRVKVLYTVLLGYFGEAMITEKNFFPPASASFENVFQIHCNLRDTTSFAILLSNTTLFPNAQNTSKEWNPTPTQILHFTISFHFNTIFPFAGLHSIE